MRKFAYCKVVLATSLVWVLLDMFLLLYFSECNKCDEKKERGLPAGDEQPTYVGGKMDAGRGHLCSVSVQAFPTASSGHLCDVCETYLNLWYGPSSSGKFQNLYKNHMKDLERWGSLWSFRKRSKKK
uniref:Uncharacterized protein n=1 Tax=Apteryx owenii TaxID=8824 RepID=A0A8B9QIG0_APTOW